MAKAKPDNYLYLKIFLMIALGWILVVGSFFSSAFFAHLYLSDMQAIMYQQPSIELVIVGAILNFFVYLLHVCLLVFIYYQAGHLLSFAWRPLNALVLAGLFIVLLEKPFVKFFSIMQTSTVAFAFLNIVQSLSYWIAYFAFAFALVYFCPTRGKR